MNLIEAIILGVIQGLTEFLPVSSSAHLLAFPWIMGWEEPPFVFDTSLHIGTLIALFLYFRSDIKILTKGFFKILKTRDINSDFNGKIALYVLTGSIPAGIIGVLFEKKVEAYFHSPYVIVSTLIFWGILLWYIDRFRKKKRDIEQLNLLDAIFIGMSQTLALIPGTSRSGVTMTAALFARFDRATATRFSFLLSIPITTGAALYKLKDLFKMNISSEVIINFTAGVATSAIVGYLCIAYLLKFIRTNSFTVFAIYRVMAGLFLAITLPSLLQGKIELEKINVCYISANQEKVNRGQNEKYIFVKQGDKVILEPKFVNTSSGNLEDIDITLNLENNYAKQINIQKTTNVDIKSGDFYPNKESVCGKLSELESMGKSYPFIIEISDQVKKGAKIPIRFTITNTSGKRIDFDQDLKVN